MKDISNSKIEEFAVDAVKFYINYTIALKPKYNPPLPYQSHTRSLHPLRQPRRQRHQNRHPSGLRSIAPTISRKQICCDMESYLTQILSQLLRPGTPAMGLSKHVSENRDLSCFS